MTGVSVGRLWQYPVKSMQGEEVEQILLGPGGVAGDRAYGFVDVESGKLASAKRPKRFGALLDCRARFISPPTVDGAAPPVEVTFPDGTVVRSDGDDGAELTRHTADLLGREVRLITTAPDGLAFDELVPQIDGVGENPLEAMQAEPPDSEGDRFLQFPVAMAAPGTMVDLAALHVLATSTLRRLADEYRDGDWDPRRMRPNILIDDGDGNEDDWVFCDVHIGEQAVVHVVGPTPRCVMTTLAQPGLPKDSSVLKTIARVGRKEIHKVGQFPCAGSYAEVVTPGVVRRGDPIRFEHVEPRKGALAATIDVMAAALAAGK
ncbi:MAG TPA: MOSC domain-containing protein [Mycobacterium sp.]|nr:MOSC domain-containing protein [Mycobacterium sp.]